MNTRLLVAILTFIVSISSIKGDLLVNTKHGPIEGHVVTLADGSQVRSFLGVPYAKPPTGQLRFRPPEEPDPWTDVFQADNLGNACPQEHGAVILTHPFWDRYDEDCLNMNIFTPYNHSTTGPYPVMAYIHGGAYMAGANIGDPGHFYAVRGVIFVAMNYRLGQLGFLYSGDDAARGNYGLLDQQLALRFIQENIANFNGDPNRVTVSGFSSGGSSAGLHTLSPSAAGLFHQILLSSGTDLVGWAVNAPWVSVNMTHQIAEDVECPTQTSQEMVDCLRGRELDAIMNANFTRPVFTWGFSPTPDGEGGVLPDTPLNLRERGEFHKVPILTGRTDGEAATVLYTILYLAGIEDLSSSLFREVIENVTAETFMEYGDKALDNINKAIIFQYSPWPHLENDEVNKRKAKEFITDIGFGVGMDQTIKYHSKHNLTCYLYEFAYHFEGDDDPEWMGVIHGEDLLYNLGRVLLEDNPEIVDDLEMTVDSYNQTDKDYANYWLDLFANFVKHGNPTPVPHPSPGGKPDTTWRPFTMNEMYNLYVHNNTIENRLNLRQRYNALWTRYIPWMFDTKDRADVMNIGKWVLKFGNEDAGNMLTV